MSFLYEQKNAPQCALTIVCVCVCIYIYIYFMILFNIYFFLAAVGLTPGGNSTVCLYTQTIHRTTQLTNWEECRPCPVFVSYTLAFALQLRKKHRKTSVRVAEECQLAQ
jgi:hypothetical protein